MNVYFMIREKRKINLNSLYFLFEMTISIRLPKIKKKTWDLAIHCILNYSKGYAKRIFNEGIGKEFLEDLLQIPEIGRFQWKANAGQVFSVLQVYLKNFLIDLLFFAQNNSLISEPKEELINSEIFKAHFDRQYSRLESEVLLDDYFRYKILIPAFRILLKDTNMIELDPNHIIKNIVDIESPYGNHLILEGFKKQPLFWTERREQQKWASEAQASIEVSYIQKKRQNDEAPYAIMPYYPLDIKGKEKIDDMVLSIHDFFMLYSEHHEFFPFSISHYYWVEVPPFSDIYPFIKGYIYHSFPPPRAYLRLYEDKIREFWTETWNAHYKWFYDAFYGQDRNLESKRIFRYTVNTLRSLSNIQYVDLRVFILVSTLEGLLYKQSIGIDLGHGSYNKQDPVIAMFKKISEDQEKTWIQFCEVEKENHQDLIDFFKDAFRMRNNIAHPEKFTTPKYLPSHLYEGLPSNYHLGKLKEYIQTNLKEFLWFLLKIWIDKKILTKEHWFSYLEMLKNQILNEREN